MLTWRYVVLCVGVGAFLPVPVLWAMGLDVFKPVVLVWLSANVVAMLCALFWPRTPDFFR